MKKTTKQIIFIGVVVFLILVIAAWLYQKNRLYQNWFSYCSSEDNRGFYPLFSLNNTDPKYSYYIQKDEENYFLVMVDNQIQTEKNVPFNGSAMKISSADFPLDDYLNKKVTVSGCFTTKTGVSSYYLQTVEIK